MGFIQPQPDLIPLCYFKVFKDPWDADSIASEIDEEMPQLLRRRIFFYLLSGHALNYVMGMATDVFDKAKPALTLSDATDGTYFWAEALPYYVLKYGIKLPKEFLDHVAANHYKMPELDIIEITRLTKEDDKRWRKS